VASAYVWVTIVILSMVKQAHYNNPKGGVQIVSTLSMKRETLHSHSQVYVVVNGDIEEDNVVYRELNKQIVKNRYP
jgi:hypothetical protein